MTELTDLHVFTFINGKAGSILASPGGENWRNSLILICGYYFSFYSVLITVFTYHEEFRVSKIDFYKHFVFWMNHKLVIFDHFPYIFHLKCYFLKKLGGIPIYFIAFLKVEGVIYNICKNESD